MKIAYLGSLITSDSEFPLIRALQRKNLNNYIFYFPAEGKMQRGGVFNLNLFPKDEIIPANKYKEFKQLDNYFDISQIYIINNYHRKLYDIRSWIIWIKFFLHIKKQDVDIFHHVWPFRRQQFPLFFLKKQKVMTVHDPIMHSGKKTFIEEHLRKRCFKDATKLLLLSDSLKNEFIDKYKIPNSKIVISRFGYYDWINYLYCKDKDTNSRGDYLLFCGQIQPHKGVDILLNAMLEVHKVLPELKCVIAGGGKYPFDISPYLNLDYIELRNYFIEMNEMIDLIRNSIFVICPYKDATQSGIVQLSLSSNVPLIVTNVGALPKVVKDGVTGIIVPPSNKEVLAKAILRLIDNPELLERFRQNIEKVWKKDMSWDYVVDTYNSLYDSALNS